MSQTRNYAVYNANGRTPVKAWVRGVQIEEEAIKQLENVASLPFIFRHVAAMPDVHWGRGATVGSVIPTIGAIIPAAVGVDLGCGMSAVRTGIKAENLPDSLVGLRGAIEAAVPHGRTAHGNPNLDDGGWRNRPIADVVETWRALAIEYVQIISKHPKIDGGATYHHLGTLGTGNHFIEVCLDENDFVWFMLHSGSRGPGNRVGSYFIEQAKEEMRRWFINLPDADLAYIPEGSELFEDYVRAVSWAQNFAYNNRALMMHAILRVATEILGPLQISEEIVHCHHNYLEREHHFDKNVWVTRKGAIRARAGDLGIIPGSMGTRSYVVRGRGNPESFMSSSHGAGRAMSRGEAKRRFTLEDHIHATEGVECRKDATVIDETPKAYKDIEKVMAAQEDLVEIVHTLKQIVCVKG